MADASINNDEQRAQSRAEVEAFMRQPSLAARLADVETAIQDLKKDIDELKKKVG